VTISNARPLRRRPAAWLRCAGWQLRRAGIAGVTALIAAGLMPPATALAQPAADLGRAAVTADHHAPAALLSAQAASSLHPARNVCSQPARPGFDACLAIAVPGARSHRGLFAAGSVPPGYGPASLQSAYHLPSASAGAGQTVAIVDANDDPSAESNLAVYRAQYHLPPCTTANGCFRKVAQDGSRNYPAPDGNWSVEISLDLDMVSAICPNCHILLVEADDASSQNLGLAVNEAVALGAKYVSNSYDGPELPTEGMLDAAYYNHPGVVLTVAAGDSGYGVNYPAASPDVTAVGGTTLTQDPGTPRGWTETAWGGTGSGCSAFEAKPSWQHDKGCAHRTVADVAAVADPATPVAIYDTYPCIGCVGVGVGWGRVGGTSVATPLIASVYALAGPPFGGSYPSSYPYADPSALNHVTKGSNGKCTPRYLCHAGPGYNGPTGLGTPDGVAAFTRPHGDITGTVTDAATGKPLAGAQVQAGGATAVTSASGRYDLAELPGAYRVQAVDYSGFAAGTASGVRVSSGQDSAQNFGLTPAPDVTLTGKVTDGSGQGWGLAAKVSVPGTPAATYTNPATGSYRLRLPPDGSYTIQEDPLYPGYLPEVLQVASGTSGIAQDFSSVIDGFTCAAPGYHFVSRASEDFSGSSVPPGWAVTTTGDPENYWRFDQPGGYPNLTGGTGNYAVAYAQDTNATDTMMTSPAINLSGQPYPVLTFDGYDPTVGYHEDAVELSTDGGKSWTTIAAGGGDVQGQYAIALPQAADKPSVRVRFTFTTTLGDQGFFWQVDDFSVAGCDKASGGLVAGQLADANTGRGIDGATVSGAGQTSAATTSSAPGLYWLFSARTGPQSFTGSARNYTAQTRSVTVTSGQVTRADFRLTAGRIAVASPPVISGTAPIGGQATASITVRNTGTAPASVAISSAVPGGYSPVAGPDHTRGAPVRRIPGHYRPGLAPAGFKPAARTPGAAPAAGPGGPWALIANYPAVLINVAATADPATGNVYAVGGIEPNYGNAQASAYMFDPATGRWSALPPMRHARQSAQAAFIGGRLYVTGGTYFEKATVTMPYTEIYDPATNQWTAGASVPKAYWGAATAVLDGKMYVIGGCDPLTGVCGQTSVQVYDPVTNHWSTAASYPIPASFLGCGSIAGQLYCAGGVSGPVNGTQVSTRAGYVYDPRANSWSPIAALPADLWGSAYAAANGQLLMSGGITANGTVLTNQGYAYDPAQHAWSALPNSPGVPVYEAASACGFYQIGGVSPGQTTPGTYPLTNSVQLAGYGACGGSPWLTTSPDHLSLAPGQSATIKVTLSAAPRVVSQPGTYTALLQASADTPYPAPTVRASLVATPPASWGALAGTIRGCASSGGKPLAGATVQVTGQGGNNWVLTADRNGRYQIWLDTSNNPLTEIVSQPGWRPQAAAVTIKDQKTTTRNFTLSKITGKC
jgi:hypothetical protein